MNEQIEGLDQRIANLSLELMLDGVDDGKNAILSINAGAGGTEAQDWAEMLMRMYIRYGERKGFKVRELDLQEGDVAGLKSVSLEFDGELAFGYLKGENGVHRLVRLSPFDAGNRRHTSFASVDVYPDMDEDIEIEVKEEDIRVDTFRQPCCIAIFAIGVQTDMHGVVGHLLRSLCLQVNQVVPPLFLVGHCRTRAQRYQQQEDEVPHAVAPSPAACCS